MRKTIFAFLFFFCTPAYAQGDAALCQFWKHINAAPPAAYQPGVDVRGNPVAPADINASSSSFLPSRITFPVNVDLAQALNLPLPAGTQFDANMGMIEVYTDGRVLYNGQDMSAQTQAFCAGDPVPQAAKKEPETLVGQPEKKADEDIIWGEGH
ncbi:MAG: hypothetical protein HY370_07145 [Proteobacteria bacterium]|nr:hypothetical protein [Pseudomonadota bacterium]